MDPNEMSMSAFEALSPEQQMALLDGGEMPQPEAPAVEAVEPPAQEATEVTPPAAPEPAVEAPVTAKQGNPEVPLRAAREQLRQYEALLTNPDALAAFIQQQGIQLPGMAAAQPVEAPDLWDDPNAAIGHHVQQAIAPLQSTINQQQQFIKTLQDQARMNALAQHYGTDAANHIAQFDAQMPGHADLDPELKLLAVRGALAANADPNAQQAVIQQQAQALAEQMLADKLAQMGSGRAVTLAGAPPAKGNDAPPDLSSMGMADFSKLTPEQIKNLGQQF
jgi:hypothetical protein